MPVKKNNKIILILLIVLAVITAGYILFKLVVKKAEINVVSGNALIANCRKGTQNIRTYPYGKSGITVKYTCYDGSTGTLNLVKSYPMMSIVDDICQRTSAVICRGSVRLPTGTTIQIAIPTLAPNCQARGSNCSSEKRCCQGFSCLNGSCDTLNCKANGADGCLTDTDCCTGLICDLPTSAMYGSCKINPAPKQCSGKGASCLSNSDCCSGLICGITSPYGSSTETLKTTCIVAPTPTVVPIQCKANGVSGCSMDSECCPGLICTFTSAFLNGTCTTKPTGPTPTTKKWQCSGEGLSCMSDYDCCAGLTCRLTSTELYGSCGKAQ